MRTIKFRSWNPIIKRMTYLHNNPTALRIGFQYSGRLQSWAVVNMVDGEDCDEVLMQYTGVKDSNGKDIYEGDILKDDIGKTYSVFWDECSWCLDDGPQLYDRVAKRKTIIGNIHENPELCNS